MTVEKALYELLQTPNESDSNGEVPNVVDGLYNIARAIRAQAAAQLVTALLRHFDKANSHSVVLNRPELETAIKGLLDKYWTLETPKR